MEMQRKTKEKRWEEAPFTREEAMEEGASPPRWALDKKLGEDASMEEKKEGEKERGGITKLKEEKGREVELWVVSHKILIHQSYNKCYTCFYL